MAMAGYDPVIPLDEVIATVKRVGRSMDSSLCNTGLGGLAVTPKARELKTNLLNLRV
jgi:L-serine dehydratase